MGRRGKKEKGKAKKGRKKKRKEKKIRSSHSLWGQNSDPVHPSKKSRIEKRNSCKKMKENELKKHWQKESVYKLNSAFHFFQSRIHFFLLYRNGQLREQKKMCFFKEEKIIEKKRRRERKGENGPNLSLLSFLDSANGEWVRYVKGSPWELDHYVCFFNESRKA